MFQQDRELRHIESIRAFAALSVAVFHFTHFHAGTALVENETARQVTFYGAQGVEIFYLISGFIIPYALLKANYNISSYFRYLAKRFSRLFPPYLVTIAAIIVFDVLLSRFVWYSDYQFDFTRVIVNLFFLADLFPGIEWINPIFATLKVEVQFYLLAGLVFPLLIRDRWWLISFIVLFLVAGICTRHVDTVLTNAPYFSTGIIAFFIYRFGWKWQYILPGLIVIAVLACYYLWEDLGAAVLGFTLVIGLPKNFRLLRFTGKISYSYYLVHGLIGGWFLYFTRDTFLWHHYSWLMILCALGLSWAGALIMYIVIEKPCLAWAGRIKYKRLKPNH